MVSLGHILRNSAELNRLQSRIDETFLERQLSREHLLAWSEACKEFHRNFDRLVYPGGAEMLDRVRRQDPSAIDAALAFLQADPIHFRSGYLKENLWRWLVHCSPNGAMRTRLERAALGYLDRPLKREFAAMCRAMHRLGREGFWMSVSQALLSSDASRVRRAELLLIHKGSLYAGAIARRELWEQSLRSRPGEPEAYSHWLGSRKRWYNMPAEDAATKWL